MHNNIENQPRIYLAQVNIRCGWCDAEHVVSLYAVRGCATTLCHKCARFFRIGTSPGEVDEWNQSHPIELRESEQ